MGILEWSGHPVGGQKLNAASLNTGWIPSWSIRVCGIAIIDSNVPIVCYVCVDEASEHLLRLNILHFQTSKGAAISG
jgi:hypothetical protein